MNKNILIVGCGDVGAGTGRRLLDLGYHVYGVRRTVCDELPFPCFVADVTDKESLARCLSLIPGDIHYVIYSVAPSARTKSAYQDAYPLGVKNVLSCIDGNQCLGFLLVTSTAVYHQQQGQWVDEDSDTSPDSFSGQALLQAEAVLYGASVKGVAVRFGGIYGPARLRLINKVNKGCELNQHVPVYTNRIHREDCIGVLCFLIEKIEREHCVESCYVAVDSYPASEWEVLTEISTMLSVKPPVHNSTIEPAGQNKRCNNKRLRSLGYEFLYDSYREGYRQVIALKG